MITETKKRRVEDIAEIADDQVDGWVRSADFRDMFYMENDVIIEGIKFYREILSERIDLLYHIFVAGEEPTKEEKYKLLYSCIGIANGDMEYPIF